MRPEPAVRPSRPGGASGVAPACVAAWRGPVVVDTQVVLDLLLFQDPAAQPLHQAIQAGRWPWLATPAMRAELQRVLGYPKLAVRLAFHGLTPAKVLAAFDAVVQPAPAAPRAPVRCKDPDDQMFIDLAVQHRALLLSKDRAVLCMKKRLLALDVIVLSAIE